ncbi:MAG TPA: NAD(P)H-dependent oxidoreductase [Tepidisphaeraceae bacterium]|nr:NAD(P)H-dependent oxidoreductase [Tepidisphaeraceae bacterium]
MEISIILAHPSKGSFNHAIADMAAHILRANGHTINYHDLHAEQFDPILPAAECRKDASLPPVIQKYCDEIARVDGIIVVHPNWWGQPPAILKGWVDRVLRQGVAYVFGTNDKGEGISIGRLKARHALVFNTANTPADVEKKLYGDPLENLWKTCIFDLCGVKSFCRRLYTPVIVSSLDQRKTWLDDVRETVGRCFPSK